LPNNHQFYMSEALALAKQAALEGEVPVGAVVVAAGEVIGRGYNRPITASDPTAHAEIVAMREAAHFLQNYRLTDCDLYVTIEPCVMCVGAMVHGRIRRVIFGAPEPRAGALVSQFKLMERPQFNHHIDWQGGVLQQQCSQLIKDFFKHRR
jgi:tRNA(adenine34) deaminase